MTTFVTDRSALPAGTTQHVVDKITLDGTKRERMANGFLRIRDCTLAKADNVQTYLAGELGLTDRPATALVRVYRPRDEVFNPDSMATFASVSVTDDHPSTGVTADNARQVQRGWSSESVREVEDHVVSDLVISDAGLIGKVEAGKAELSNGYAMRLVWESGTSPKGETYDAIMRNIVGNHIAVVDAGRCGGSCRISDASPPPVGDCCPSCQAASDKQEGRVSATTKTILVDGLMVETTDAGAAAIELLKGKLGQAATALQTADAKAATDKAAWDAEKTRLETELAAATAKVPTADAIAQMVAQHAQVVVDAKKLAPTVDVAGKSADDIRKLAVTARLGDTGVAGKDQAWLNMAFDMLVLQAPAADQTQTPAAGGAQDALAAALAGGGAAPITADAADKAWAENSTYLQNAWMGEDAGKAN